MGGVRKLRPWNYLGYVGCVVCRRHITEGTKLPIYPIDQLFQIALNISTKYFNIREQYRLNHVFVSPFLVRGTVFAWVALPAYVHRAQRTSQVPKSSVNTRCAIEDCIDTRGIKVSLWKRSFPTPVESHAAAFSVRATLSLLVRFCLTSVPQVIDFHYTGLNTSAAGHL